MTRLSADDPLAIRQADADLLSLALIDARNHTLRWLSAFETRGAAASALPLVVAAGAWQDQWIGRHVQRQRGEACDAHSPRLAAAEPGIQAWLAGQAPAPDTARVRDYLADTLDTTLGLLALAAPDDTGLHFYRAALRHEDRLGETLAERAAALQLPAAGHPPLPMPAPPARPWRDALGFPPQHFMFGSPRGGSVPENERWAHEVALPGFEIDAQAVSWARYAEFAEDGGYDRAECWSAAGWAWLQADGRRAPRHVEQLRGGVALQRHGRLVRAAGGAAAVHVTRHEAEAWCRWAGRRLPGEAEWECAALAGAARGFAWGDVFEWVAGPARGHPGYSAGPGALDALPALPAAGDPGAPGVLKGASWLTPPRQRHPKARRFAAPARDDLFAGFRSAAL